MQIQVTAQLLSVYSFCYQFIQHIESPGVFRDTQTWPQLSILYKSKMLNAVLTNSMLAASSLVCNQLPSGVTVAKIKHTNKTPHTACFIFLIPDLASLGLLCHGDWTRFRSIFPLFLSLRMEIQPWRYFSYSPLKHFCGKIAKPDRLTNI